MEPAGILESHSSIHPSLLSPLTPGSSVVGSVSIGNLFSFPSPSSPPTSLIQKMCLHTLSIDRSLAILSSYHSTLILISSSSLFHSSLRISNLSSSSPSVFNPLDRDHPIRTTDLNSAPGGRWVWMCVSLAIHPSNSSNKRPPPMTLTAVCPSIHPLAHPSPPRG